LKDAHNDWKRLAMDELQRLAIETALSILADYRDDPGSQETGTVEAARKILTGNKVPATYEFHAPVMVQASASGGLRVDLSPAGNCSSL
jgi:hypothetical protein